MQGNNSTDDVATELEAADNDVVRAVDSWSDCDVAALVKDGGNVAPVTRLGDVLEINDLDAAPFVLVKANQR